MKQAERGETMAAHTPGPWYATEYGIRSVAGYICEIHHPFFYDGQFDRYKQECSEREADAKLIAAAPDLLEALQAVMRVADRDTVEFDLARSAIAKATT